MGELVFPFPKLLNGPPPAIDVTNPLFEIITPLDTVRDEEVAKVLGMEVARRLVTPLVGEYICGSDLTSNTSSSRKIISCLMSMLPDDDGGMKTWWGTVVAVMNDGLRMRPSEELPRHFITI